jgi:hypothetical protein
VADRLSLTGNLRISFNVDKSQLTAIRRELITESWEKVSPDTKTLVPKRFSPTSHLGIVGSLSRFLSFCP